MAKFKTLGTVARGVGRTLRLNIPVEIQRRMSLKVGDLIEYAVDDGRLVIRSCNLEALSKEELVLLLQNRPKRGRKPL